MRNSSLKYIVPSGIVAVLALALVVSTNGPVPKTSTEIASGPQDAAMPAPGQVAVHVTRIADRAFGALSSNSAAPVAAGRGGGGGGSSAPAPAESDKMAIMPWQPTYYSYAYAGDLPLDGGPATVYRRKKGAGQNPVNPSLIDAAALNLVDASRLGSLGLQSLSLMQDKEFGYMLYVDMNEGMISMNQNYAKWPHPEQECRDEACYARYRLAESDMLSDEQAIAVAGDFLKELGVNVGAYGAPAMSYDWRAQYAALKAEDRANFYFPETVSVVYPLMIDGQKVYDESGMPMGLTVNVNVRHKRADGLWNLTTLDFDSAQYEAVSDAAKFREVVERGGVYEGVAPEDAKKEKVDLGVPERVLMRAWSGGQEVVVPALRFPVVAKPADQPWFRDAVIIPLVKDLFEVQPPMPVLMVK